MSKHEFTSGPWETRTHNYANYRDALGVFPVGSNTPIVDGVWGRNLTESEANARLIASAPALLAALQEMTPPMPAKNAICHSGLCEQNDCSNCDRIARAHVALALATGGKP